MASILEDCKRMAQEQVQRGSGLLRCEPVLSQQLVERTQVGLRDQAAAALTARTIGRADRTAAGPGDRSKADPALVIDTGVLVQLALDTQWMLGDGGQAALQQG